MTYILHLETATKVCSVALSRNGQLVTLTETDDEHYSHGENLTLFIEWVLKDAGIQPSDLSAVSIASGPGSYTGLRIGGATAKGLCFSLGIPLIAIDALTCLAAVGAKKHPGATLCPVIDARRMEVYNCIYSDKLKPLKDISADIIDEDSYRDFEPFVCFGDGAKKLTEVWKERKIEFDLSIKSTASGQVGLAYEMFNQKDFVDTAYWEPFYLKDFVAGQKKK